MCTNNGHSHYYTSSEIYHPSDNYWRAAVGEAIGGFPRHVRWYIQADPTTSSGI